MIRSVIIGGPRSLTDRGLVFAAIGEGLAELGLSEFVPNDFEIVSGMARGVDSIAVEFANIFGINIRGFPITRAEKSRLGGRAGHRRNWRMAEYASTRDGALISVYDNEGPLPQTGGSRGMFRIARDFDLDIAAVSVYDRKR